MSLVKCPECGHEVSDEAKVCPNCGYKLKKPKHHPIVYVIAAIAGVVLIAGIGTAIHDFYMADKLAKKSESVQEAASSTSLASPSSLAEQSTSSSTENFLATDVNNAGETVYYGAFESNNHYQFTVNAKSKTIPNSQELADTLTNTCDTIGITSVDDLKLGNYDDTYSNGIEVYSLGCLFLDQNKNHILVNASYYGGVSNEWLIDSISNFDNGHVYYVTSSAESMVAPYNYGTDTAKQ